MTHRGKSAKLVFIILIGIAVLVLVEMTGNVKTKGMPPNSPVALDAVKAQIDANSEINAHFRVCPADVAEKVRTRSIPLSDVDISAEECGNDSEVCYKKCLDGRNGSACLALARIFEARKPIEDPIHAQMLYAQACATGSSSGCTNRASGIRNSQLDGDPMLSLAPQVLANCYFRTFQFSCDKDDAWGCAMLGQTHQVGEGVEPSESEARRYYQRACEIDGDFLSCNFARKHIKELEGDAAPSLDNQANTNKSQDDYDKAKVEIDQLNVQINKLRNIGKYQEAIPFAEKMLEISARSQGQHHTDTAFSLNNLAGLYRAMGAYNKAEPLLLRALAIREKALGPEHPDTATSLNNLAGLYRAMGAYRKAEPLYQRALAIYEKALGPEHPHIAASLGNLAVLYHAMGAYGKAEPLYQRALAIYEKALGPEHPSTAASLNNLAGLYDDMGAYSKAEPLYQRALAINEKALGPEHPSTAASLSNLAELYSAMGAYGKAEPLYQRALTIYEKALGPEHTNTATSLNNLAELYRDMGAYAKAEPLFQRALLIYEKTLGPEHPSTATDLNNLAMLYKDMGSYGKAEPLFQRALAINEKALGADHTTTAISFINLADLYRDIGAYSKAEPLLQRALAIRENALRTGHPDTANTLNSLALLYSHIGAYGKAEPLYQRALAIREKALEPEHPDTATSLNNLAEHYREIGAYSKAEPLYQHALAIREKALGSEHPDTAASLNNLAELYRVRGAYAKAEPLFQRALAIYEKALGHEHPDIAANLNNLAALYQAMGAYSKAEPLYQRALAIDEKTLGSEHPSTAINLNNLAVHYVDIGAYAKAESLYQRGLTIYEKTLGPEHPGTATLLNNLGHIYWLEGRLLETLNTWKRAYKTEELNAQHILALGDEARKKAYMKTLGYDSLVSFSLAAEQHIKNPHALGLELVLQRKGRVLEAVTDSIGLLRQHLTPADQVLLDQMAAVRSQQAVLMFNRPAKIEPAVYQAEVTKLNTQAEDLESKLSARSAEFKSQHQTVTLEKVQLALPKGGVLVEFVVYSPFNPKAIKSEKQWGVPQYMAYVLHPSGEAKGIVLGEAKELDTLIDNWRKALSNPLDNSVRRGVTLVSSEQKTTGTANAGQQLYSKLIKPLLPLIGDTKTLFVAPDGDLNLVPLGALPDETGHYLLETHEINYLTSGRDMLKWSLPANIAKQPVVLANPDFGSISKKTKNPDMLAANHLGRRSGEYNRGTFHFDPLSGTAEEAQALSKLLIDETVLTGAKATETALKALHSPRILHLATHGFFLPDQPDEKPDAQTAMLSLDGQRPLPPSKNENPLLRSGIALAGANLLQSGNEDGVLTALEASGLDLWGTQLVVLSACETGIGKVSNGEGVYGLRRALVNAGAEAQVMSLWKVDDAATRDLMVEYYKRLLAGAGRAEALRQTQLAMLNSKDRNHPYYWAAFIASGDVRPINKK
jgi:CHAT domain-containing protein/Tfp pilus assembly protein PilF